MQDLNLDILSALKDGDSFCKTAMSRREDSLSCIDVTIVDRSAHTALPSSDSKTLPAFRAGAAFTQQAQDPNRVGLSRPVHTSRIAMLRLQDRRKTALNTQKCVPLYLAGLNAGVSREEG
jgi:hypothetical protein